MVKTMTKQIKKIFLTFMCGTFLLANKAVASAATKAVYEYDTELLANNVYRGVINTDGLNVRSAAGKDNPVIQVNGKGVTLSKQDEVAILDETLSSKETWYKVSFLQDEALIVGYVHSSYVEPTKDILVDGTVISAATEAVYEYDVERKKDNIYRGIVNIDGLNVRSTAGKDSLPVKVNGESVMLNKQDEVAILDETLSSKETWYKVSFLRGITLIVGYVHNDYVDLTKDVITPLPTLSPISLLASSGSVTNAQEEEPDSVLRIGIAAFILVVFILIIVYSFKKRRRRRRYR